MHVSFLAAYWWAVLIALGAVVLIFVFVAGRSAEGGLGARASLGWSRWKGLSKKAAELQARIVLTVFYFTVVMPFGLARTFGADPLQMKKSRPEKWLARQTRDLRLDDARRQF